MTQNYGLYNSVTLTQALYIAGAISWAEMCVQNKLAYAIHYAGHGPVPKQDVSDLLAAECDDIDFRF